MKLPLKTFATVAAGMITGWAIDQLMMKIAVDMVPQLATPIYDKIHVDDILGIGICLAIAFFVKQPLIRRIFIIAGATIAFMEITEFLGVTWPKVI
jgi:hypothetical protein